MKQVVFLGTSGASRGGLMVGISVQSKESFLKGIERWHERVGNQRISDYQYPTSRFAFVDGFDSKLFKNMAVSEFEAVFTEDDRKRLGRLLEYGGSKYGQKYPVFLKAIYQKYGYEYKEEEINATTV
jgi:hypothetical protein